MNIFVLAKKSGSFSDDFLVQNLAILAQKSGFRTIFFETTHQICLKLGQKLGTIALNHRMAVLCLGNFLFWPFWPFLDQKYIACGDLIWFWSVFGLSFSSKLLMFLGDFCYLNYVFGLGMIYENLSFNINI